MNENDVDDDMDPIAADEQARDNAEDRAAEERAEPPKPRPIAIAVSKRERTRLVKAELLMELAITAERWAKEVEGTDERVRPFAEWPDDDPRKQLCHTYQITPSDLARICRRLGDELENSSMRRGYEDVWR